MTEPEVYLIARPEVDWVAMSRYLRSVGGYEWEYDRINQRGEHG